MSIFRINKPHTQQSVKTDPVDPKTSAEEPVNLNEPSEDEEGPTIVLDGPLSQIYTQALNKSFGFENMTQLPNKFSDLKEKEKELQLKSAGTYVYCCDSKELDSLELTRISNQLMQVRKVMPENSEVIVAVESRDVLGRTVGLLRDFSKSMGAKVYLTRNGAMEAIKIALEGIH